MIFVIKLQDNRYFVMSSSESKSHTRILFEAEILYDYPKKYLPESIHSTHKEDFTVDLDRYVKHYMYLFGIENVRGGSYLLDTLPDYQQKSLEIEMNTASKNNSYNSVSEKIIEYANMPHTKEEIQHRLKEVKTNYETYKKEKLMKIDIDIDSIRNELHWLRSECDRQRLSVETNRTKTHIYRLESKVAIERYRNVLQILKLVRTILVNVLEISIEDVEVKHPEFIFDDFLYHHHNIHLQKLIVGASRVLNVYDYNLNIIENRKAERDFDINSWGTNAEMNMSCEIYLLEHLSRTSCNL
jgi:hypothetical protein